MPKDNHGNLNLCEGTAATRTMLFERKDKNHSNGGATYWYMVEGNSIGLWLGWGMEDDLFDN